ncbi:hypothetical protein VE00_08634 [Pseudogymnoascus sp. WSF 3629]|nr:hypothetical protein VE00_08634 [Pseudogymnoascus sp. WSF 3629]
MEEQWLPSGYSVPELPSSPQTRPPAPNSPQTERKRIRIAVTSVSVVENTRSNAAVTTEKVLVKAVQQQAKEMDAESVL